MRKIINIDVQSYYPSLMIKRGYASRNTASPTSYEDIFNERIQAKNSGDKVTANALKLVLNSTYGAMLNQYNDLYDPLQARSVCITGQLLLLELANHLRTDVPSLTLVSLNTDGILVSLDDADYELLKSIYNEWEERTGFVLEEDQVKAIYQANVNSYIMVMTSGKVKLKGGYLVRGVATGAGVFSINQNMPIVSQAIVDYYVNQTPIEQTINSCDDPKAFQIIAKASGKYSRVYQLIDGEECDMQRCNRVFATTDESVGRLYKVKKVDQSVAKIENLPEHCLVCNATYPSISEIDKDYYIQLAKKRALDFAPKEVTVAATAKPDITKMNVYQKLALARLQFLRSNPQKSGSNDHSGYDYFELEDIVPLQIPIFNELGLLEVFWYEPGETTINILDDDKTNTTCPMAKADVINVHNPEEVIHFQLKWSEVAPIISKQTGKPVNQPIQSAGAEETYLRRYLKMAILDIVEADQVDNDKPEPKPTKAKPKTQTERAKIAKDSTDPDGEPTDLQLRQLKKSIKTMKETYGADHPEVGKYITELAAKTDKLANISKAQCEEAIRHLGEMKESFEVKE